METHHVSSISRIQGNAALFVRHVLQNLRAASSIFDVTPGGRAGPYRHPSMELLTADPVWVAAHHGIEQFLIGQGRVP